MLVKYKLFKFNLKLNKLHKNTPTYDKYDSILKLSLYAYDSVYADVNEVRRILPLKSLKFKAVGVKYHYITYDKDEFDVVILNPVNDMILKFINTYNELSKKNKKYYYELFNESLELLLKLIDEKIHHHSQDEVVELIEGLYVNLPENAKYEESVNIEREILKERLKFELEYFNRLNNKEEIN